MENLIDDKRRISWEEKGTFLFLFNAAFLLISFLFIQPDHQKVHGVWDSLQRLPPSEWYRITKTTLKTYHENIDIPAKKA